jgi:hypothetical protein
VKYLKIFGSYLFNRQPTGFSSATQILSEAPGKSDNAEMPLSIKRALKCQFNAHTEGVQ